MTNSRAILKSRRYREVMAARWRIAMVDPYVFLRCFVWTVDTHDILNPIKQLPATRPHIKAMTNLWQNNLLLAICKSRQMMMTWLFCALSLWEVLAREGRLIMLQSKTEREAVGDEWTGQGLLGRCKFILSQIPDWLVPYYYPKGTQLIFPKRHCTLWAIPQGADIIRSYTAAGILSDECGVQDEFEEAYTAAIPTIRGGGWFTALSTANPGFFERLYTDTMSEVA